MLYYYCWILFGCAAIDGAWPENWHNSLGFGWESQWCRPRSCHFVHGKPICGNLGNDLVMPEGIKTLFPIGCKCWMPLEQHPTVQNCIFGSILGDAPAPPIKSTCSAPIELLRMVWIVLIDTRAAGKIFGWPQLSWNWWSSGYFCYWSCHRPADFWEPLDGSTGALWKCFECNCWAETNHSDIKAASSAFGSLKLAQNPLKNGPLLKFCFVALAAVQQLWWPLFVLHSYHFVANVWVLFVF